MPMTLTVDQSLVDKYLARVDRFVQNVNRLGDTNIDARLQGIDFGGQGMSR